MTTYCAMSVDNLNLPSIYILTINVNIAETEDDLAPGDDKTSRAIVKSTNKVMIGVLL